MSGAWGHESSGHTDSCGSDLGIAAALNWLFQ
jgi:hypothetical protein